MHRDSRTEAWNKGQEGAPKTTERLILELQLERMTRRSPGVFLALASCSLPSQQKPTHMHTPWRHHVQQQHPGRLSSIKHLNFYDGNSFNKSSLNIYYAEACTLLREK